MIKEDLEYQIKKMLEKVKELTNKTNKHSVLIIQQRPNNKDQELVIPMIRESLSNIISFICVGNELQIDEIIKLSQGVIDTIIFDDVKKRDNSDLIRNTVYNSANDYNIPVFTYNDFEIWSSSAINTIKSNRGKSLSNANILLLGYNYLATRLILQLIECNANVYLLESEYHTKTFPFIGNSTISLNSENIKIVECMTEYDMLLGCSLHEKNQNISQIKDYKFKEIYDIGVSNFDEDFIEIQKLKGCTHIYRSDDRAGVAGLVLNLMETNYLSKHCVGCRKISNIELVAGGVIGEKGAIVVDSIENPKEIFGVANGDGTFKTHLTEEEKININKIKTILA